MPLASENIRTYLSDRLGVDISGLTDDSPLFSSSLVDSFSLVELITFVETQGSIKVDAWDVTLDNFDSIERILEYVKGK
jgi:acyl carrier protein